MKRYTVTLVHLGREYVFDIVARDEKSACNKAVKRAQYSSRFVKQDKSITTKNVVGVRYEGFYLNRQFIPVDPRELYNRFLSLP